MKSKDHLAYVPHNGTVACYHCGDSYQVTPCSLGMAVVVIKQFTKEHTSCKPREAGETLRLANVAKWEKLPKDQQNTMGVLGPSPVADTLGEKLAHAMVMDEMAKHPPAGTTLEPR